MVSWFRLVVGLAVLVLGLGAARADWRTNVGIDIATGGESILLVGDLDEQTSLYAGCVSDVTELFVSLYDGRDEAPNVGPVNLIITSDTGASWTGPATYLRERSAYIVVRSTTPKAIPYVVGVIIGAKDSIDVSIEYDTGDLSGWTVSAKGSTAAGRNFLDWCGLAPEPSPANPPVPSAPRIPTQEPAGASPPPSASGPAASPPSAPAPPPAPAVSPPVRTGVWTAFALEVTSGVANFLRAPTSEAGGRLSLVCAADGGLATSFGTTDRSIGIGPNDAPIELVTSINGEEIRLSATYFDDGEKGISFVSDDAEAIWRLAEELRVSLGTLDVAVVSRASGARRDWSVTAAGAGQAAATFVESCNKS